MNDVVEYDREIRIVRTLQGEYFIGNLLRPENDVVQDFYRIDDCAALGGQPDGKGGARLVIADPFNPFSTDCTIDFPKSQVILVRPEAKILEMYNKYLNPSPIIQPEGNTTSGGLVLP